MTGALDHLGGSYVSTHESIDTHGAFERRSDGISALDGDPSVQPVFELINDGSGTADGAYVDDERVICRSSTYGPDSYYMNEGTSMATPHVSGIAALVRAAFPQATASQVARAIRESAVALPALAGKTLTGGRADAPRALAAARRLTEPPTAPSEPPAPPSDRGDPAGGDRTAPRARLVRARLRGPFLLLTISFPGEPGAVTGSVEVAKLQRGPVRFRARPGRPAAVRVKLRPAARRALAGRSRARPALTIRARDAAGNTAVTRTRLGLRAP